MNKSFIDDETYEQEEMDDEIEEEIELEIFDEEDEDLNQISSYWKTDNDSGDGYGRKKRTNRFEINDGF